MITFNKAAESPPPFNRTLTQSVNDYFQQGGSIAATF
jgi:hypothetical protein